MHPSSKILARRPLWAPAKTLLLAAAVSASLHSASAQILYSTSFENPPFANGSTLLGQDGWSTAIPTFLNPNAATITNVAARTGLQSVRVRGADLVSAPDVAPNDAIGSYRYPLNYNTAAPGNLPIVRIQADIRLDGPVIGTGDFFSVNLAGRSNDGGDPELSISSDGMVYGYGNTGILYSAPITLNAWHTLGISIDFAADTYTYTVDGISSSAFPFGEDFTSNVFARESLVAYAQADGGGNVRSAFTAYYDNVSATAVVPEPASASLLTLGCVSLLSFRRRTRR